MLDQALDEFFPPKLINVQRENLGHFPVNGDQTGATLSWYCLSLQFLSPPEGGALHARLDCALVLSPGFGHQVGFSFLQTSSVRCLLLFGELPAYFLTHHILQETQKRQQMKANAVSHNTDTTDRQTATEGSLAVSATDQLFFSKFGQCWVIHTDGKCDNTFVLLYAANLSGFLCLHCI